MIIRKMNAGINSPLNRQTHIKMKDTMAIRNTLHSLFENLLCGMLSWDPSDSYSAIN